MYFTTLIHHSNFGNYTFLSKASKFPEKNADNHIYLESLQCTTTSKVVANVFKSFAAHIRRHTCLDYDAPRVPWPAPVRTNHPQVPCSD